MKKSPFGATGFDMTTGNFGDAEIFEANLKHYEQEIITIWQRYGWRRR